MIAAASSRNHQLAATKNNLQSNSNAEIRRISELGCLGALMVPAISLAQFRRPAHNRGVELFPLVNNKNEHSPCYRFVPENS